MLHLGGNLLHPHGIGRFPEDTDRGGIPAKGGSGKGIDQVQLCIHGKGICMRVPIKEWDTRSTFQIKILVRSDHPWDHQKGIFQEIKAREENVGLVRFELTIDGSLRHASVLQRVIIKHQNLVLSYWCSPWQVPER